MSHVTPRITPRVGRVVMWLAALALVAFLLNEQHMTNVRADRDREQVRALALETRHDAGVTTSALCALRTDLERRVAGSKTFLAEHPAGIPGISAKVIRDGIKNQERTIKALSGIDCPK